MAIRHVACTGLGKPPVGITTADRANGFCYTPTVAQILAKIVLQEPQNQQDDRISGQQLVLSWAYKAVYDALWRMEHGAGLTWEVQQMIEPGSPQLGAASRTAELVSQQRELGKFMPKDLAGQDWAARQSIEIERDLCAIPESGMFARLIHAGATRTVRLLANQSRFCTSGPLGLFLRDYPEQFLAIKISPRFPKDTDKQIEFLARGIAAVVAGYMPRTGNKYLFPLIQRCEHCTKPAAIQLNRGHKVAPLKPVQNRGDCNHTAEQCRNSTWPCPIHHPFSPSFSGRAWCGTC